MNEKVRCPCCGTTYDAEWDPNGDGYLVPRHNCGGVTVQFRLSKSAAARRCQDPRALRKSILKRMEFEPWPEITSTHLKN